MWIALAGWLVAAALLPPLLMARRRLELVADAEHELRAPLAVLELAVEQVRRGRSGADLAGLLDAQLDRSRAGLWDLEAALRPPSLRQTVAAAAWRRLEATGLAVRGTCKVPERDEGAALDAPLLLGRLAHDSAGGWSQVAAASGRRLRLDWQAGSAPIDADRSRLSQALGNLLSNALEHGAGDIDVVARRTPRAIRIEVTNAGEAGRAAPAAARPGRGRGLGIATRAVEGAGGTLELASGHGRTAVALELPLGES